MIRWGGVLSSVSSSFRCSPLPVSFFHTSQSLSHGKQILRKRDALSHWTIKYEYDWSAPLTAAERKTLPDVRDLTNREYIANERHIDQRLWASLHGVFPDLMPTPVLPEVHLLVEYPKDNLVHRGNWMKPIDLRTKPKVSFEPIGTENTDPWSTYWSLIMLDLDDPIRKQRNGNSKQLWKVVNIPAQGKIEDGQTLVEYLPPTPFQNTGSHRILFAVCQQADGLTSFQDENHIPSTVFVGNRTQFSFTNFLEKYRLKMCGYVFFQSQWDESVTQFFQERGVAEPIWETEEDAIAREMNKERTRLNKERVLGRQMGLRIVQ
jgi:hypothetical protein